MRLFSTRFFVGHLFSLSFVLLLTVSSLPIATSAWAQPADVTVAETDAPNPPPSPESTSVPSPSDSPSPKLLSPDTNHDDVSLLSRLVSLLGVLVFVGLAFLLSNNRKRVNWRLVVTGILLQFAFAIFIFFVPYGDVLFDGVTTGFNKLLEFTNAGSDFIFSSYVTSKWEPHIINFAFATLPTIIFFSSLMAILYHLGIMQWIVSLFSVIMQKTMRISGAESLSVAANIFVGQTEAPLVISPYVSKMTNSELNTVMTGGFATVAGGVMAIYVGMLSSTFPDIAGHLLAASVMSAPAALVVSKIIFPETETPLTAGQSAISSDDSPAANILDAASRGAGEGLKLALNVGAMLLAFISLVAMANYFIGLAQFWTNDPLTFEDMCAYLFWPLAWVMGVPAEDCFDIGRLLGVKMFINELVAYKELATMLNAPGGTHLSQRSIIIATYALCGFANFGSIGIQLGGIGGLAPERKSDLAKVAFKAMLGGTIAAMMTATVAGVLV